jgi:hypothetical protein
VEWNFFEAFRWKAHAHTARVIVFLNTAGIGAVGRWSGTLVTINDMIAQVVYPFSFSMEIRNWSEFDSLVLTYAMFPPNSRLGTSTTY